MERNTFTFATRVVKYIELPYLLYAPAKKIHTKLPLLIFLHGRAERGSDLELVKLHGPPKRIEQGQEFPFIVLAPQCPVDFTWPRLTEALNALLDKIVSEYPVDTRRVYLTGLSMGGFGTWNWAATYPERFDAIAPICGGGSWLFDFPEKVCALRDVPVWTFHGAQDEVVPIRETEILVKTLKRCGGKVRFTVYPDPAHDSWTQTYNNPRLYAWLLSHSKHGARTRKSDRARVIQRRALPQSESL